MVGALLCAPAFTACQDDPEPTGGNVAGKDDPAGNGGGQSTDWDKSWFDQPEENRRLMRWMLGDDDTLRGPGEYEFHVPAGGNDFTFWFPDCDQSLRWVDFDGIVQLIANRTNPVTEYVWNGVDYNVIDESCIRISIPPDRYSRPHRYVFSFHALWGGGIVRFVFNQDAAEDVATDSDNGKYLFWNPGDENLISYHRYYYDDDYYNKYYDEALAFYPEQDGGTFAFQCLNGEDLEIKSLACLERYGTPKQIGIADSKQVSCGRNLFRINKDSLVCELDRNDGDWDMTYLIEVASGNKKTKFYVGQRGSGNDKGKIYPYAPEWTAVEDGRRWTGGLTNDGVFRIPAEGNTITVKSTGLYNEILVDMVYVNGEACPNYTDNIFLGYPDDYDSAGTLGGVISYKHKNWDSVEFGIQPNYTEHERVITVRINYDVLIKKTVVYWMGEVFNPSSFIGGYDKIIFVQPPKNPTDK